MIITYVLCNTLITESGLLFGKSNTSNLAAIILSSERGESTPTTTNIQKVIFGLKVQLAKRWLSVEVHGNERRTSPSRTQL